MNFDMENLEPFLLRVTNFVPEGFGQSEVSKVMAMVKSMAPDEEKEQEFPIQFAGKPSSLRVRVFMDDIDAPDVYFFSPRDLATTIDAEMERFCEELGL